MLADEIRFRPNPSPGFELGEAMVPDSALLMGLSGERKSVPSKPLRAYSRQEISDSIMRSHESVGGKQVTYVPDPAYMPDHRLITWHSRQDGESVNYPSAGYNRSTRGTTHDKPENAYSREALVRSISQAHGGKRFEPAPILFSEDDIDIQILEPGDIGDESIWELTSREIKSGNSDS